MKAAAVLLPGPRAAWSPDLLGAVVMVLVRGVVKNAVALGIGAVMESLLLSPGNMGCGDLSPSFPVSGSTAVPSVISLELSACWLSCGAFVFPAPPLGKQSTWRWGVLCITVPVEKGKESRAERDRPRPFTVRQTPVT